MIDRYNLYWQGKSPKVRAATEDFLTSGKPVKEIAEKHGVSIVAISNNAKQLKYRYHVGQINLGEALRKTSLTNEQKQGGE